MKSLDQGAREQKAGSDDAADRRSLLPGVLLLVVVAGFAYVLFKAPADPRDRGDGVVGALAGGDIEPLVEQRCVAPASSAGFRLGAAAPKGQGGDDEPRLVPFSPEVGGAIALADGFAVGVKHNTKAGTMAAVALLDQAGANGKLVELIPLHGDVDAPLIASYKDGWVAAVLEANASGLALRLARPADPGRADSEVIWGAEIEQGRDESLVYDLAFGDSAGVVVWDELRGKDDNAVVMLARVGIDLQARGNSVVASRTDVDAEQPRLVRRQGGFWLAYLASDRRAQDDDSEPAVEEAPSRFPAERIEPAWIELLPLSSEGAVAGEPQAVTPRGGRVVAFDMHAAPDGGALIAWRDDDTPSGAHGGSASVMQVGGSGVGQVQPVADEDVGAGVPRLLPGWLALADAAGRMRLAPIDDQGTLEAHLVAEPLVRSAYPLALRGAQILFARPAGKAIEFEVMHCDRKLFPVPPPRKDDDSSADAGTVVLPRPSL